MAVREAGAGAGHAGSKAAVVKNALTAASTVHHSTTPCSHICSTKPHCLQPRHTRRPQTSLALCRLNYAEQHVERLGLDQERLESARVSASRSSPMVSHAVGVRCRRMLWEDAQGRCLRKDAAGRCCRRVLWKDAAGGCCCKMLVRRCFSGM